MDNNTVRYFYIEKVNQYCKMSIVLTRFSETITLDKAFVEPLAEELRDNNIVQGTMLLAANEFLFDPSYVFSYNDPSLVKFPGRYDIIIVADSFKATAGKGKIDLTGSPGISNTGTVTTPDPKPSEHGEPGTAGEPGDPGRPANNGGIGFPGMNIKVYCRHLADIELVSNGSVGGTGGTGGRGGNGGMNTAMNGKQGAGGRGGTGGTGGRGGNGGKIEVFSNELVNISIISNGGTGGTGGTGGNGGQIEVLFYTPLIGIFNRISNGGGQGSGGEPGINAKGDKGQQHGSNGSPGINSVPDIKQTQFSELWERVRIELAIPS